MSETPDTMTTLTLGQAAKLAGIGKTTLTRAIKSGRLSAERREDGSYRIDASELTRIYDVTPETPETVAATGTVVRDATPARDPETVARQAALDAQIEGLKEIVRRLDDQARDLRQDRDQWRAQAERLALTGPAQASRSWWKRLVG